MKKKDVFGFVRRYKSSRILGVYILMMLLWIPHVSRAGGFAWEVKPKYYNEWRIGYGTTFHTDGHNNYVGRALVGMIHGAKLNEYAQLGVGVDGVMFTHYYKGQDIRWALDAYVDMRGFYPVTPTFKVFMDLGLGTIASLNAEKNNADFFCQFGPGLQYKKFTLTMGLQHIGKKANTFYSTIGFTF